MKRMVGRRMVETGVPTMEWVVTVLRRWPWQKDVFHGDQISVEVNNSVLMVTIPDKVVVSYNDRTWRRVISKKVPSRARV